MRSLSLDGACTFHLQLSVDPQVWYRLEKSDDLKSWIPISTTLAPEHDFELIDPGVASATRKFYRVSVIAGQ